MVSLRKMASSLRCLGVLALLLGLSLSCSEPLGTSDYLRSDEAASGEYRFELPLKDSLCVYQLWIYGRAASEDLANLELEVKWKSPSGLVLEEKVYMRELSCDGSKELYRSEIRPGELGSWALSLRPRSSQQDRIAGLGIILDGTR